MNSQGNYDMKENNFSPQFQRSRLANVGNDIVLNKQITESAKVPKETEVKLATDRGRTEDDEFLKHFQEDQFITRERRNDKKGFIEQFAEREAYNINKQLNNKEVLKHFLSEQIEEKKQKELIQKENRLKEEKLEEERIKKYFQDIKQRNRRNEEYFQENSRDDGISNANILKQRGRDVIKSIKAKKDFSKNFSLEESKDFGSRYEDYKDYKDRSKEHKEKLNDKIIDKSINKDDENDDNIKSNFLLPAVAFNNINNARNESTKPIEFKHLMDLNIDNDIKKLRNQINQNSNYMEEQLLLLKVTLYYTSFLLQLFTQSQALISVDIKREAQRELVKLREELRNKQILEEIRSHQIYQQKQNYNSSNNTYAYNTNKLANQLEYPFALKQYSKNFENVSESIHTSFKNQYPFSPLRNFLDQPNPSFGSDPRNYTNTQIHKLTINNLPHVSSLATREYYDGSKYSSTNKYQLYSNPNTNQMKLNIPTFNKFENHPESAITKKIDIRRVSSGEDSEKLDGLLNNYIKKEGLNSKDHNEVQNQSQRSYGKELNDMKDQITNDDIIEGDLIQNNDIKTAEDKNDLEEIRPMEKLVKETKDINDLT